MLRVGFGAAGLPFPEIHFAARQPSIGAGRELSTALFWKASLSCWIYFNTATADLNAPDDRH